MSKYKIAVLPGDGTGKDVMEAARIVLDKIELEAEYVEGDIGWEFWCEEGNPLPDRTIQMLKETDVCLFAAITSKPKEDALKELHPKHRDKGYSYFSPIVRLRQEFDLYTNLRPCKAYPGNPLNYRDDIDLVIFRENTEGMYAGVEFHPLPEEIRDALLLHPKMGKFKDAIICFDKAIEISPDHKYAWYNKGVALARLGTFKDAIACYNKAIELDPQYLNAWFEKGIALDALGKFEEAITCYDGVIELDPNDAVAYYNKACAKSKQKKQKEAIDLLKIVIKMNPAYKNNAKTDSDFDNIRESKEFRDLIENESF